MTSKEKIYIDKTSRISWKNLILWSETSKKPQLRSKKFSCASPVFTVENVADNNPIHATHSKICTRNMHDVQPITAKHSPTAKPAELHNVKPAQF